jgi:hypothetical protein
MSVVQRNAIGLLLCWWCLLSPLVLAEPLGEKKTLILRDSPVFCKEHDETKELHTLFQTVTRIESHDFDSCHDQTMSLIKW